MDTDKDTNNTLPVISTKGGDKGQTSLLSGERVPKNHPAMICMAELDDFDTQLGLLYVHLVNYKEILNTIKIIQKRLIYLKGEIATHPRSWNEYRKKNKAINDGDVKNLDMWGDNIKSFLEEQGYKINGWMIYGEDGLASVWVDSVRAKCRKFEGMLYELEDKLVSAKISDPIKQYINRLSDYLYWVARYLRNQP